ncbi:MAG: Nramp family divalent metal transporter [Phycisphaerae bacterium]|nr:Nramp family divalent metal transporter [Phycisphaerae bacterium]
MSHKIPLAPRGLAILAMVGPAFIWCAEYIGSGEVILATRTGALMGTAALWAIVGAIVLKCSIGMAGAQWTAVTGEGMIDLFRRMPGPRDWFIWLVLVIQFPAAIVSIGALAKVAGVFLNSLLPLPGGAITWGAAASVFAVCVSWTGRFDLLKAVMSGLVMMIIVGVLYVAVTVLPPVADIARGLVGLEPMSLPAWAPDADRNSSPWREILPLMGWAAGGFASQVWYTYWVLGAGYGMAAGRGYGKSADEHRLAILTSEEARTLRGWCRVVRTDALVAASIGVVITTCFCLAGAGVLRTEHLVPQGEEVAFTLSRLFSSRWGALGAKLFLIAGSAAMISTQVGQLAGWPRLLADCIRIVCPPFSRIPHTWQFRAFLLLFVVTNLVAVVFFDPVRLVKLGGQLDGILLTPLQALAILAAFFLVLPKLVPHHALRELRPGWLLVVLLAVAAVIFGILCFTVLPGSIRSLLTS